MMRKILTVIIPFFAYLLFRCMGVTWRITVHNPHNSPTPDRNRDNGIIFAFWHNRLIAHTYYYRHCGITALISQSRDGEYIARCAKLLGHNAVRGSTTRNSKQALAEMIDLLRAGKNVTITPDGPQGPKHRLQPGVVEMARQSGAVIVPMAYGASKKHIFKSWDGFILPLFFSRINICFGEPLLVPRQMDADTFNTWIKITENALIKVTKLADESVL